MIELKRQHRKAKSLADQAFNLASMHTHDISPDSVELLQKLRDDIMSYLPVKSIDADTVGISQSEANSIEKLIKPKPKRHSSTSVQKFTEVANAGEYAGVTNADIPAIRREIVMYTHAVRRVVSLPVPVQLDVVPSASLILKALDRIFRTYVRGTALPGQLAGGNTVELDGTTVSFRNFILHGPYISWKGFVTFLLDFAIASPPPVSTRSGRSFLADVLNGDVSRLPGGGIDPADVKTGALGGAVQVAGPAEGEAVVAPVNMMEAAVVFIGKQFHFHKATNVNSLSQKIISYFFFAPLLLQFHVLCTVEASKSITPALVLSKFLQMYEEMAQNIEGDPWASVCAWAEESKRGEWEIRSGVNFMQFVDCLGVSASLLDKTIIVTFLA